MNTNNVWFITPKTNLHVGNENTSSYGLIDLGIQKNVTTQLPCINSSSLKGALNEFATNSANISPKERLRIFGCDKSGQIKDTTKGTYTFFDANILFIPKQSDTNLFQLVTSDEVLTAFFNQVQFLTGNTITEGTLQQMGFNYGKVSDKEFKDLCSDDNLPIIARNELDNGESKNLWYEQVLPAESVLYTFIDDKNDNVLSQKLSGEKTIVQIGAGATIGYGYCMFKHL